eukprot:4970780-Pyramimonas_sp.AAC.1
MGGPPSHHFTYALHGGPKRPSRAPEKPPREPQDCLKRAPIPHHKKSTDSGPRQSKGAQRALQHPDHPPLLAI